MSRGRGARTDACDSHDARVRLSHAQRFVEVAALVADESTLEEYGNVAVS